MAQQIAEITKVPTNVQVIKILNEVIKRYNSLGSIYTFKGSVQTYDDLLAIQNPQIGDVYNVIQEDEEHQIAAGSNFVWDGTVWDNLGGSLAGLVQSVNGINPDSLGNVLLPLIKNVTAAEGNIVFTKNDNSTVQFNDIKKLYMLALGENVNLNDLTESGIYICTNNANAANYENCPIQKAFLLEVQATVNSNFIFQFLTQYNDGSTEAGNQYIRTYYNNNWSAWRMAGSGSNLTTYTSLEQLGITPGQESFASIHSALPINSVLEYYVSEAQNFADIYPASDGNFIATRLTGDITIFHFTGTNQIMYVTHYHVTNNTNPSWTQIAKQSDLTNLSSSINTSLKNYLPLIGGLMSGTIKTSKTTGTYRNGNLGESIINSTAANGSYTVLATMNSTNGKFTLACFQGKMLLQYTSNATIATEKNKVDKSITLMDESGSTSLSTWTISKGTNGWARESSTGFTIQWGYLAASTSGNKTITLPRSLSSTNYAVATMTQSRSYENYFSASLQSKTRTSFVVSVPAKGSSYYTGFYWILVGY